MPVSFLSEAERLRFNSFPKDLSTDDLIAHFTLTDADLRQIPKSSTPPNQLGFALQLLCLRFLGFYLADLGSVPKFVIEFVATQIGIETEEIKSYGERGATLTAHRQIIEKYLAFHYPTETDSARIENWLLERALEHDRPALLLQLLCERFLQEKIVRPGFSVVERMVTTARTSAETAIFERLEVIIDDILSQGLDELLIAPQPSHPTPLAWLRQSAPSNTPKSILGGLQKLSKLQKWEVGNWNLSAINPNRRKQLAQIGFRSTAQALSRMNKIRRYPILLAFLSQLYEEVLDELVEIFDRLLATIASRTERQLIQIKQEIAMMAGDKIKLLQDLVSILIDPHISDDELRPSIHQVFPEAKLQTTFIECEKINEPLDEDFFTLVGKKYNYLRQFIPVFLHTLPLDGNVETKGLREAIEILRDLNENDKRKLPADAPTDFVSAEWREYVFDGNGKIVKKYYELCVMFELRQKLRSGDMWVEGSRRYARLESYLIPAEDWEKVRPTVCELLNLPTDGMKLLKLRQAELQELYGQFDRFFDELIQSERKKTKKLRKNKNEKSINDLVKDFDPTEHLTPRIQIRLENDRLIFT